MPPTRAVRPAPARTNSPPVPFGRRWWVLLAMCTAQLMVVLDATIMNIALPESAAEQIAGAPTARAGA